MIFNVSGHIEMIRNGLQTPRIQILQLIPGVVKTQTRRPKRGVYQVEAERKKPHKIGYAVQRKRGVKAEPDIRIVFDKIWEENGLGISEGICVGDPGDRYISKEDAWAEGGYTPKAFEELFRKLNPKRDWSRWAFEFHVMGVQR